MSASTLVIQSCNEARLDGWMGQCVASVQGWADDRGFDYHFVGDEIFRLVPDWYMEKVGRKLPVATDLGRLKLLQMALQEGYERAIWLDADVLVFDRSMQLDFEGSCAFGQEVWVQEHEGQMASRRNVHNAVAAFRQGCSTLPFLIDTVESLIHRVHPEHIAPQMVGPKLLGALHSICAFSLLPQVGALSPAVVRDICGGSGRGPALDLLRRKSEVKPQAVNLCASLISDEAAEQVIATLTAA
jgi:hypothetical protein